MAEAVMLSIKPKWADLILKGKKKKEVRKTQPKRIEGRAFKVYLYVTGDTKKVIGECECYDIYTMIHEGKEIWLFDTKDTCLTDEELHEYAKGGSLYGWPLRHVKKYDNPKSLELFGLKTPPQSWCYIEEKGDSDG